MSPEHLRELSEAELNRALLARQLLLERGRGSLPRTLERIGGIQAQYAPSMYVGLWSRLEGFERAQLTRALEQRAVVQATLLRSTIHLVSARDYWPLAAGIRGGRREWWVRTHMQGPSARELAAAAHKLRRALAGGSLRRREIEQLIGKQEARGVGLWLDLVRVPPSGTWDRRRADLYAAAEDWLGPDEAAPEQGIELLVERYLRGFGPAPAADIANWIGIPTRAIAGALQRMELRRFRAPDGGELLDLRRAPLPDPETPAPVRFLPTWDATLLVHARRAAILLEEYRPRIFHTRNPQSTPTFLVDGAVAGTWRYDDGHVRIEPFSRLDPAIRRELDEEAERLAAFHA